MRWLLTHDPGEFLALAGDHLAQHAVVASVLATQARRRVDHPSGADPSDWYAVARDEDRGADRSDPAGRVIGAAMRTSTAPGRPAYLGPMPDGAAALLARTLHERGDEVVRVGGSLTGARIFADETARLVGGRVEVRRRTRLLELGTPVPPRPVPGRLRVLGEADLELATAWYAAFAEAPQPVAEMQRRVTSGRAYFWLDADERPVQLTASTPPSHGVARIAPVYTPVDERGRGWASAAVHAVAGALVAEGARVCLFTDLADPTSNALYARLGFVPVVDMADHVVVPASP